MKMRNQYQYQKCNKSKKDENKMLLEYRGDVDDKLFKKFSDRKNFNSFINEFDCATNEEDKENIVKKSKDMSGFVKGKEQKQ